MPANQKTTIAVPVLLLFTSSCPLRAERQQEALQLCLAMRLGGTYEMPEARRLQHATENHCDCAADIFLMLRDAKKTGVRRAPEQALLKELDKIDKRRMKRYEQGLIDEFASIGAAGKEMRRLDSLFKTNFGKSH